MEKSSNVTNPNHSIVLTHKISVPNLRKISSVIFESRDEIAKKWVSREVPAALLAKLEIEPVTFKEAYGIPVLEYFVGVVEGTQKIGDCPVMQKFITFLSDKRIKVEEVFILCMALRRSLITFLFDSKSIQEAHAAALLEEVSEVFDSNLTGVLSTFSKLDTLKEKKLHEQLLINKQQKQIQTILNLQDNIVCMVKNGRIALGNRKFFEALGVKGIKSLSALYPHKWRFITKVDCEKALFESGDYNAWLNKLIVDDKCESVKVTIHNEMKDETSIYLLRVKRVPDRQADFILSLTDVTAYEKRIVDLATIAYTDKHTGLCNRVKFDVKLKEALKHQSGTVVLVSIDQYEKLKSHHDESSVIEVEKNIANFLEERAGKVLSIYFIEGGLLALLSLKSGINGLADKLLLLQEKINQIDHQIEEEVSCSFGVLTIRDVDTIETIEARNRQLNAALIRGHANTIMNDDQLFAAQHLQVQQFETIMATLEQKFTDKEIIKATVAYKQMPVSWDLAVSHVLEKSVVFQIVNETSLIFLAEEVYFALDDMKICAKQILTNIETRQIELGEFTIVKDSILDRKNMRVEPQKGFKVLLFDEHNAITGRLRAISVEQLSFSAANVDGFNADSVAKVDVSVEYEEKSEKLTIDASVNKIVKRGKEYHVSLLLNPDTQSRSTLKAYIAWRQIRIIKELKSLISTMMHR